ncbi:YqhG family protein [Bacillaceae bacterium S4-13-58]
MKQETIHKFIQDFFTQQQCEVEEVEDGALAVQLTEEMDEKLMNRPFYWHYVRKMGRKGDPMKVTFYTKKMEDRKKGEWIHFGSPRLHQIFNLLLENTKFVRAYENPSASPFDQYPLIPWLMVNMKVQYRCHIKKEEMYSVGLQLTNGKMIGNFMESIRNKPIQSTIPDYAFQLTPIIKPISGLRRIENRIKDLLEEKPMDWALEAKKRWEDELKLLRYFYEERQGEEWEEKLKKEEEALKERFYPRIDISVINGGIIYLTEKSSQEL